MPNALLSLSDKSGLVEFAHALHALGWDILASGGTASTLKEAGIPVTSIANYTNSPEILGGRVKTLHPAVHGGILARDSAEDAAELKSISAELIDLVVCNLYPFEKTISAQGTALEDAIENIDIGGVTLIRAAAKNFERVTVVTDPADFELVLAEFKQQGNTSIETRLFLAQKAFSHTAAYDAAITGYLAGDRAETLRLYPIQTLRYGENWHQSAEIHSFTPGAGPMGGTLLQGKSLSYNNMLDLDAAWRAASSFDQPTVVIVKHLSPCGIASGTTLAEAYPAALASDPVSAFGSVIAVNQPFDESITELLGNLFVECIAAPSFTSGALERLALKKNLRLLHIPTQVTAAQFELRTITGGAVRQSVDLGDPPETAYRVVSERAPSEEEWRALHFAWKACQHVRSNAIVFARGQATVGIGGGQPNRLDCVAIAGQRAGELSRGAVMASDAFFPFPDAVEAAATLGITAIIQPGGSIRDNLSIDASNKYNIAMVTTGVRHFRH